MPDTSFYRHLGLEKLEDQHRSAVDADQLLGRLVVVNFIFTSCPHVCPAQTRALSKLYRELPPDLRAEVSLMSISVDPTRDRPDRLKAFAKTHGANFENWHFMTGEAEHISKVLAGLHVFDPRVEQPQPADHSKSIWLLNRKGEPVQRYRGEGAELQRVARELAVLAKINTAKD